MSKKYNGLNSVKTDLAKAGICELCGYRLSNPLCTHATPEQIKYTQELDAQIDAQILKKYEHSTNDYTAALEYDTPDPTDAEESDDIQKWLADNWDGIPKVEF